MIRALSSKSSWWRKSIQEKYFLDCMVWQRCKRSSHIDLRLRCTRLNTADRKTLKRKVRFRKPLPNSNVHKVNPHENKRDSASLAFLLSCPKTLSGRLTPNTHTFRSRGSWATKSVANHTVSLSTSNRRFCRFLVNSIPANFLKTVWMFQAQINSTGSVWFKNGNEQIPNNSNYLSHTSLWQKPDVNN